MHVVNLFYPVKRVQMVELAIEFVIEVVDAFPYLLDLVYFPHPNLDVKPGGSHFHDFCVSFFFQNGINKRLFSHLNVYFL